MTMRREPCPDCKGGRVPKPDAKDARETVHCSLCKGRGTVTYTRI